MKSSYNPQEEINDLNARVSEMNQVFGSRMDQIDKALADLSKVVQTMLSKQKTAEDGKRRTEVKAEGIEGSLAQKLKTLGEITKHKRQ